MRTCALPHGIRPSFLSFSLSLVSLGWCADALHTFPLLLKESSILVTVFRDAGFVYVYVSIYLCVYIYICVYVCTYVCVCVCDSACLLAVWRLFSFLGHTRVSALLSTCYTKENRKAGRWMNIANWGWGPHEQATARRRGLP